MSSLLNPYYVLHRNKRNINIVPVSSNTNSNANINIVKDNNGDGGNRNNKELTRNVEHEMCDHTVMIDATGIVTKGLKKNLEAMPEKHSVDSLQNTAILRTSYK